MSFYDLAPLPTVDLNRLGRIEGDSAVAFDDVDLLLNLTTLMEVDVEKGIKNGGTTIFWYSVKDRIVPIVDEDLGLSLAHIYHSGRVQGNKRLEPRDQYTEIDLIQQGRDHSQLNHTITIPTGAMDQIRGLERDQLINPRVTILSSETDGFYYLSLSYGERTSSSDLIFAGFKIGWNNYYRDVNQTEDIERIRAILNLLRTLYEKVIESRSRQQSDIPEIVERRRLSTRDN